MWAFTGQATSQQKRWQHVSVLLNTLLLDLLFKLLLAARKEYFVLYLFQLCFFVVVCIFDCICCYNNSHRSA